MVSAPFVALPGGHLGSSASGVFSTVPEPTGYMSFLAGLAVLGALRARKRSA